MKRILENIIIGGCSFSAGMIDSSGFELGLYGRGLLQVFPPGVALINYFGSKEKDNNYNLFEIRMIDIPVIKDDSLKIAEIGAMMIFPYIAGRVLGNIIKN